MSTILRVFRAPALGFAAMLATACSSSSPPTPTSGTNANPDGGATTDPTEPPDASTAGATHVVKVSDFAYEPAKLKVAVGDTVRWVWTDGTHTVTEGTGCTAKKGGFDSALHTA